MGIIEAIDVYKIKIPTTLFYGHERFQTDELVDSIKRNGLIQPIIVRTKEDSYEIVAGCRRHNVCKVLGLRKIIFHVLELDDRSAFEVSLVENIQRKNLDAIEEARAFKKYVDDFGWGGICDLASRISKSTSYVCKRLALLKLPLNLLDGIRESTISPGIGEELIPLHDDPTQVLIADIVLKRHLSSRETRLLVERTRIGSHNKSRTLSDSIAPHYQDSLLNIEAKAQRSFDKSITALKIAMNKIGAILDV